MYKQTMNLQPDNEAAQEPKIPVRRQGKDPAFYKETKLPLPSYGTDKTKTHKSAESKYRRVAKFLILIGSEQAAGILSQLDLKQVEEISKEIALVKTIKPEEKDEILSDFHSLFSSYGLIRQPCNFYGSSRGGIEAARRILYAAKGPEKGEELLNKAIPESKENLFGFLEEFSSEQLAMLLKDENAQTAALIISRIPPKLSADILRSAAPERKTEILKRIAHQREVAPEVLEQVSAALKEKVRHIAGSSGDVKIDGMQTLAAILKQGDYSFGDRLLNEIEEDDPEIGQSLKERLYTLDDITGAEDRPIQNKLKTMTDNEIAILLKGRKNEFYEKILSNVSAGRRKMIREEMEILGAVPKRDCDACAKDFLAWFRTARENGDILLYSDEDVVV